MTGLLRLGQARHLPACLVVTVVLSVVCAAWPSAGVVADVYFFGSPRGVSAYELSAVALAVIVPSLSIGATAPAERLAQHRRLPLAVSALAVLVLPVVPFLAWLVRVTFWIESPEPWESPVPVLASLLLYGIGGLLAVRFVGMVAGAALFLVGFVSLVLAQNREGSEVLASSFSTARDWHWNPWVTLAALLVAGLAMWQTNGTSGLLAARGHSTGEWTG